MFQGLYINIIKMIGKLPVIYWLGNFAKIYQ